jgi:hypothetical protein
MTWSTHSLRIEPISLSAYPFCQGERGDVGRIANADRLESADKDLTISPVSVTDEIAGSLLPTACLRDLICDPFCGWMRCDAKPQNMSPAVHDQQSIEQAKRDCRHDEHIHRRDPISVIADKGSPALRRRGSPPDHVFGDAGLADLDTELKQLAVDPEALPTADWQCSSRGPAVVFRPQPSVGRNEVVISSASTI